MIEKYKEYGEEAYKKDIKVSWLPAAQRVSSSLWDANSQRGLNALQH